jgi:hypothetical protein
MDILLAAFFAVVCALLIDVLKVLGGLKYVNKFLLALLPKVFRWKTLATAVGIFLVLILSDFTPLRLGETLRVFVIGPPKQEKMVEEVEREFDQGHFPDAIARARSVITEYERSAKKEQSLLEDKGASAFPEGKVPLGRIWESMDVLSHGSLNSVGVAWVMIGRSEENQGHTCEAKQAYDEAIKYSYAMAWDPQSWPIRGWSPYGFFWSPSDTAKDRALSVTCNK